MAENRVIIDFSVTGNGEVQINKVGKAVEDLGENGQKSLGKLSGAFNVFAGTLASDVVLGAFNKLAGAARALFDLFVVDGIKAAVEQQDALNRLGTAMEIAGQASEGALDAFDAFASEIQATTKFTDDAVISAGALIESLTQLDEEGLERATRASIDLAAALGKDLDTASQLVAKALEGNTAALAKFGIRVEEGKTKAETFENVLSKLEARFGGTAQQQINTYSGAIAVLEHNFGEIGESVGNAIITNQSLVNVLKAANDIITSVNESVKDQKGGMQSLVSDGILLLLDSMSVLVTVSQLVVDGFLRIKATAIGLQGDISTVTNILTLGLTDAGKRAEESSAKFKEIKKSIEELEAGNGLLGKIQDSLQKLRDAAAAGVGAIADNGTRATNSLKGAAEGAEELSKAQLKLIEQGVQLAQQGVDKDPAEKYQREVEALNAALEANKISLMEYELARLQFEQEANEKLLEGQVQLADQLIAENQRAAQQFSFTNAETIRENDEKLKTILENEGLSAKQRAKIERGIAENSKQIEAERGRAIMSSLDNLASFQNAKSKEIAAVGKAAAIIRATIDTYQGASAAASALAGIPIVGPVLAAAAAATFIAAGLARVAQISGVQLAEGITSVPAGFPNDTFQARLSSGERVVDAGTNEDLKLMTATFPMVVSLLGGILGRLSTLETKTTVNIGTRTLVEEVRSGIQAGRTLDV